MLIITVPAQELFDDAKQEFLILDEIVLELEHSLISLSKWESIHEKAFLGREEKTNEELVDYVRCMVVGKEIDVEVLNRLSPSNLKDINDYINKKMSATWFSDAQSGPKSSETVTAELIYYWMIALQIPLEFENRHLNHLFTLIRVANLKNSKPKKMSQQEIAARNRELNAKRRAQLGTPG